MNDGTYETVVICDNCDHRNLIRISVGTRKEESHADCENCGCNLFQSEKYSL